MKIFSRIKESLKSKRVKLIAASAIILSLFAGVLGADNVNKVHSSDSTTPRFNFMANDREMLTSMNLTQTPNGTEWVDPISANVGDEVALMFYFHNGMENTTAHNVTMRALLPSTVGKQHNVLSYLKSDETSLITDTVVNGNIKGFGNGFAQINTTEDARLEYIPGSTKIWRTNPDEWGRPMIDAVVNESGLNIGSVNGCWQYAGYLTFKVKVKAPAQLSIAKYVAYPGTGQSWAASLSNVKEGETVAWKVGLLNHGETDAVNVAVKDVLPAHTTYIPGTTVYFGPDYPNGYVMPDGFTGNGLNINRVQPGEDKIVYLVFQTRVGTGLPYTNGVWTGINTASATFNGQTINATARINVCGIPGVTIEKTVQNDSGNWVEQNNADLGDDITYRIIVRNTGTAALTNIKVNDVIPIYTKYINGSTTVNGQAATDGIAGTGIAVGNLNCGQIVTVIFKVNTYGCPPLGDYTLTNSAYVSATGVVGVSDTARTILHLNPVILPTL